MRGGRSAGTTVGDAMKDRATCSCNFLCLPVLSVLDPSFSTCLQQIAASPVLSFDLVALGESSLRYMVPETWSLGIV